MSSATQDPTGPAVDQGDDPQFAAYAHPDRLVSTAWLARNLGREGLVVVESNEDVLLHATGHVPGSVQVDWHTELNDRVTRDYLDGAGFAELLSRKGIARDDTIVVYGDRSNWWAAYALWVFSLFGHQDVRLLDGGRAAWIAEGRGTTTEVTVRTPTRYPVVDRDDTVLRAFLPDVRAHLGGQLVDVRSPGEYAGTLTNVPDHPQEGTVRGGHVPGAANVPWAAAAAEDGRFRDRAALEALYLTGGARLDPSQPTITYCRIGERSSHTWFVLTHLLGLPDVRNYDGSWTEWGNAVRVPIAVGSEPGEVTR